MFHATATPYGPSAARSPSPPPLPSESFDTLSKEIDFPLTSSVYCKPLTTTASQKQDVAGQQRCATSWFYRELHVRLSSIFHSHAICKIEYTSAIHHCTTSSVHAPQTTCDQVCAFLPEHASDPRRPWFQTTPNRHPLDRCDADPSTYPCLLEYLRFGNCMTKTLNCRIAASTSAFTGVESLAKKTAFATSASHETDTFPPLNVLLLSTTD